MAAVKTRSKARVRASPNGHRQRPKHRKQKELLKLDLGCGQNKAEGFTGVDIWEGEGVDVVHDLLKFPWPFKPESVGQVHSSHFLEHVPGRLRFQFMDELHRILAEGAEATFIVPYYASMRAVQDPTHEWPPICEASFLYFNREWRAANKLDHYPVNCDFDFSYSYNVENIWMTRNDELRSYAFRHYWNAINDLVVVMKKRA
ncbi:MAG: class I SAM-dependent methyltransferase [Anaerolineales bacterium]